MNLRKPSFQVKIINIQKYRFKLFGVLQFSKGNRYLHEICHESMANNNLPIYQLLSEQLAELSAILNSFLLVQPILLALLQGGKVGSHKLVGKSCIFTKNSPMTSISAIFTCIYHTKQLNPQLNSSASCVVNYSWLSACQVDMEPFEGVQNTCGCLTSLRNKPQQKQSGNISASIFA